jgi:hypothetical protein
MKLKYKKMILVISMSAMGIGMITLSLSKPKDKETKQAAAITTEQADADASDSSSDAEGENAKIGIEMVGTPGDGVLRTDAYPEINALIQNYMNAKKSCDMETLASLVNDTSVINEEDLKEKAEYIEDYKNIVCYTLNGPSEGTFLVYVYDELKIMDVNTLAPNMTRLYVCTDGTGKPYIYYGTVDDETQQFIDEADKMEDIVSLVNTVNSKLTEALTNDKDLKEFVKNREEATKEAQAAVDASDSATTTDTKSSTDDGKSSSNIKDTSSDKKATESKDTKKDSKDQSGNN